jgi:hypothetical protein
MPDGEARRPVALDVAPGVDQVSDDDVARRLGRVEIDGDRPVEEDPALGLHGGPELEREAVEDGVTPRQAADRCGDERVEPGADVSVGRVPGEVDLDRSRERARAAHQGVRRAGSASPY